MTTTESRPTPATGIAVEGWERRPFGEWVVARGHDGDRSQDEGTIAAPVPGTVAGALTNAGLPHVSVDAHTWVYACRTPVPAARPDEELVLDLEGLATMAEVWIGDECVLEVTNMFRPTTIPLPASAAGAELKLVFRPLAAQLTARHPRPRWKTRLVTDQSLRWYRTMLLGRCPGFAPGPPVVGPWRPVTLERRRGLALDACRIRPTLSRNGRAKLDVQLVLRGLDRELTSVSGTLAGVEFELATSQTATQTSASGTVTAGLDPWWPRTHGVPALHALSFEVGTDEGSITLEAGEVGFRRVEVPDQDRFAVLVNGVEIFCRGAALIPGPLTGLCDPGLLERAAEAGMNMVRLPGQGGYADEELLTRADELGIFVWQDFPFANMDYPADDPGFRTTVEAEASAFLERAGRHASLAVLCGGSEIEQQAAMLGVEAAFPLLDQVLPVAIRDAGVEVPFVRSTPTGGELPFQPNAGVSHYFGVGAYRRPLEDARRAEVRFASECLAFANIPDEEETIRVGFESEAWTSGIPADNGTQWDFGDVTDHYLRQMYDVDPALRSVEPDRYLELARAATGEVMAATLGEWRRGGSTCAGALLWWLNDIHPGPGFGIVDRHGSPKPAYWFVRRALAPVAVWLTDEGLNGLDVHLANDTPERRSLVLELTVVPLEGAQRAPVTRQLTLEPRSLARLSVESELGGFADVGYAYRFGAPHVLAIGASLRDDAGTVVARATHFSAARPIEPVGLDVLGLRGAVRPTSQGVEIELETNRLAYALHLIAPGAEPDDNWFTLLPGERRTVALRTRDRVTGSRVVLRALNLRGAVSTTELRRPVG